MSLYPSQLEVIQDKLFAKKKSEFIEIIFYLLQYLTVGVGTPQCAGLCRVFVYPPLLLPWVSSPFSIGRGKLRVNVIV